MNVIQIPANTEQMARGILDQFTHSTSVSAYGYYRDGNTITAVAINWDDDGDGTDAHGTSIEARQDAEGNENKPLTEIVKEHFESFGKHIQFVVYAPEVEGVEIPDLQFETKPEQTSHNLESDVIKAVAALISYLYKDERDHFAESLEDFEFENVEEICDLAREADQRGYKDGGHIFVDVVRVADALTKIGAYPTAVIKL